MSTATKSRRGEVIAFEQDPAVQERPLRDLIAQRGWKLHRVYSDRLRGVKEVRPGLNALMADARRGVFDVVVVWRFDRCAQRQTACARAGGVPFPGNRLHFPSEGVGHLHPHGPRHVHNHRGHGRTGTRRNQRANRGWPPICSPAGYEVRKAHWPAESMIKCFNCTAKVYPDAKSRGGWASARERYGRVLNASVRPTGVRQNSLD